MKISDYPSINSFTEDNIFLVDGNNGTKKIPVGDALLAALDMMSPVNHRTIFRGKYLGNALTTAQKAAIQDGSFKDLWVGDYWEINGTVWRIVDINYWRGKGDTVFNTNHLVIMPDSYLTIAAMNETDNTTGGYVGSTAYSSALVDVKNIIINAFGESLLTHRELLSDVASAGYVTHNGWYDSTVELPNEIMLYGSRVVSSSHPNVSTPNTIDSTQLALFRMAPQFIMDDWFWLRDVANSSSFVIATGGGEVSMMKASATSGIRPVFAIG